MQRPFLAAVFALAVASHARADIILYESLDLAVARADLVVRGEVTEVLSKKGDAGVVWSRVTVKVAEVVKGEKVKQVRFLVREAPFESSGTGWRNFRNELLICLDACKPAEGPFRVTHRLRGGWVSWAIPLSGRPGTRLPVYGSGFAPLTDGKQILAAARAAAADRGVKAGSSLEWVNQGDDALLPHAVLFPDSGRTRAAAKRRSIELRLREE